jgi:hypothetical protein
VFKGDWTWLRYPQALECFGPDTPKLVALVYVTPLFSFRENAISNEPGVLLFR